MVIDEIRGDFTKLQSEIADGPILPQVAAEEIRTYLASRYDFNRAMALEEVIADVEKMLRDVAGPGNPSSLLRAL